MNSEKATIFIIGLVVGGILGLVMPKFFSGDKASLSPPPPISPEQASQANYDQIISQLNVVLDKDPGNYQAWVELGNAYFDSNQPAKSADAYIKALEIDDTSPDVHTDLGTMYRRLKRPEDAVKEFQKAMTLDPNHFNSRQNLGITYLHDFNDHRNALRIWEDLLKIAPAGQRSDRIRSQVESLKGMLAQEEAARRAASQDIGLPPIPGGTEGAGAAPPSGQ